MIKQRTLGVAAVVMLLLAACSSGETDPTTDTIATLETSTSTTGATTTTEAPDLEEVALDFTECMRENGIDIPDITFDADGQPVISASLAQEFDLLDTAVPDRPIHLSGDLLRGRRRRGTAARSRATC